MFHNSTWIMAVVANTDDESLSYQKTVEVPLLQTIQKLNIINGAINEFSLVHVYTATHMDIFLQNVNKRFTTYTQAKQEPQNRTEQKQVVSECMTAPSPSTARPIHRSCTKQECQPCESA
jgi:hypothetical protein